VTDANELADAFITRLLRFLRAQTFLAAQIEGEVRPFHFRIGFELTHHFGRNGGIADTTVEADPGFLFFEIDAEAPRTGTMRFLLGHGVLRKKGNAIPGGETAKSPQGCDNGKRC